MIPYGKQTMDKEDIKVVAEALSEPFLTTGPKVKKFEEKFADYVGSKYAVAVSSGTAALHVAYMAAKLGPNDEIITSPMTFCATANAALYCGADVVFADIRNNGLIDPDEIRKHISKKTKIVVPVHYAGQVCDMEKISAITHERNLMLIEDAAHAIGAKYLSGHKVGSCRYSNMTIFSFHPVKHITTGEGGMITTNDESLYKRMLVLRNHGIVPGIRRDQPWYYELVELGNNYRLTDFQSSLGLSQLNRLDNFLKKRYKIAAKYDEKLKRVKPLLQENSSYHLYIIQAKDADERQRLYHYMKENNVAPQVHYIPVHYHPLYQRLGFKKKNYPKCESFYDKILSIPIYPTLTDEEQDKVIELINAFS